MFIHFAFGQLGKQGKTREQTERVIEDILSQRRLLVSQCTEFFIALPLLNAKNIQDKFKKTKDSDGQELVSAEIDLKNFDQLPDSNGITYLPELVPMICFIKISFKQLKSSPHPTEYGRFGLAFNNKFLRSNGIKPVSYYSEKSLWHDQLVKQWNELAYQKEMQKRKELDKEILSYRKPATYFQSFAEQKMMKVRSSGNRITLEYCDKYERYEVGYDFKNEQEHRIVFKNNDSHLCFAEEDLYMIITPDSAAKTKVNDYLRKEWTHIPIVEVFPG